MKPTTPSPTAATKSANWRDHARHPRNLGPMRPCDGWAHVRGDCGDEMAMWIRVHEGVISRVSFMTTGCGPSHAAGSMATELAIGRRIGEALHMLPGDILSALGGLPEDHEHCALLAAVTMQAACEDVRIRQIDPGASGA